jgi:streptomycin 6-kinase
MVQVPAAFAERIRSRRGDAGAAWLHELPETVVALAARWQLTLGEPFDLSFNYVCGATLPDGTDAVLKIGPWGAENVQEMRALAIFAGRGACRLLASDEALGASLLERIRPGRMLRDLAAADDDAATRIAARLMRRLQRPAAELTNQSGLARLADWFDRAFDRHEAYYGGAGPFPARTFDQARGVVRELFATPADPWLLHGDLHHDNVLSGQREPWLAIDPHGVIGPTGFEIGPYLLNPDPSDGPPKSPALLTRRLDIFAEELAGDRDRLRQWGVAYALLSACWSAEDGHSGWENAIAAAETLLQL